MVQNTEPRRRGRPRAYDPQTALTQATEQFWQSGYAGTSLDDICTATSMNRPSLYAAFGDKHALYLKALAGYWHRSLIAMQDALADGERSLPEALMAAYDAQLAIYFAGDTPPRGCFAVGTATTEAAGDEAIRISLATGLHALDAQFEARLCRARDTGALRADADPATLAILASATLHTIAIRARAGIPRAELRAIAAKAVGVICG